MKSFGNHNRIYPKLHAYGILIPSMANGSFPKLSPRETRDLSLSSARMACKQDDWRVVGQHLLAEGSNNNRSPLAPAHSKARFPFSPASI